MLPVLVFFSLPVLGFAVLRRLEQASRGRHDVTTCFHGHRSGQTGMGLHGLMQGLPWFLVIMTGRGARRGDEGLGFRV